jgi:hypothetical protein
MVYTIKKLEFKKLEWRLGCKTCIVYTGLKERGFYTVNLRREEKTKERSFYTVNLRREVFTL